MARSLAAHLLLLLVAAVVAAATASTQEETVYFLEEHVRPGSKMALHFTHATAGSAVLSRSRADSIPFASSKIPEILSRLSIPAGSPAAAAVRSTLAQCEAAPFGGEAKRCATSFESMVDFASSSLGTTTTAGVRAVSAKVISKTATIPRQMYTVVAVKPLLVSGSVKVACHGMPYGYAVFGCHTTTATPYVVTLAGADGTNLDAVAAFHQVDAEPGVLKAYKKFGLAPGSVPVGHFLDLDDMLWVRN